MNHEKHFLKKLMIFTVKLYSISFYTEKILKLSLNYKYNCKGQNERD